MNKRDQWVLAHIPRTDSGYAFLDRNWEIVYHNHALTAWVDDRFSDGLDETTEAQPLLGASLDEVFPAFVGMEDYLPDPDTDGVLTIPRVQRVVGDGEKKYLDLRVEVVNVFESSFLLTVTETTRQARLEQQLIQQRNELRLQITARQRAEEALRQANDQLEQRVAARTAELQDAYERLRTLSRQLVDVQEAERRQIARELHDEIGQALTGLKLLIGMSARNLPEEMRAGIDEAQKLVVELMGQVRQISLDLRPAMLDDLGLIPALLWHFERYTSQTNIQVDFKHSNFDRRFDPQIETAAYRIIQEALTNVARYANVLTVEVRVWVEAQILHLRIVDQGSGFDPQQALAVGKSSGLSGMLERASLLHGSVLIESAPEEGTQLHATLPIERD